MFLWICQRGSILWQKIFTTKYTKTMKNPQLFSVFAIANHKGGVGKTTTAVNLADGLTRRGARVLVIDADSQANATQHLGITDAGASLYDVFQRWKTLDDTALSASTVLETLALPIRPVSEGLFVLTSTARLAELETALQQEMSRERFFISLAVRPLPSGMGI